MDDRYDRRTVLATATALTGALAGCSFGTDGDSGGGPGNSSGDQGSPTDSNSTSDGTDTATGAEGRIVPPAIESGELLTDFHENRWFALREESVSQDREHAISGRYALRVENSENHLSTIGYAPPNNLSLEGRDLSMAVKVDSPVGGRLEVRLRAPNKENRYVCTRHLPPAMSDWMRIDFGITRGWNEPDIANIGEIRVEMVGSEGSNVRYWIDDIRMTETAGTPHAILAFYGGLDSHYETAFSMLEDRGWAGAVPVRPAAVGNDGRMGIGKLRTLRDAGWDVCNFPLRGSALPDMSKADQRSVITDDKEFLRKRGFPDGSRHFFAPHHSIGGRTVEVLRDVHETGFLFGGGSANVPPTAEYTIPTINGNDYDSSRDVVLRANRHDQLVVLGFDEIGTEEGMSVDDFEAQLDRIEDNAYAGGLNVITPTELVDQYL